MVAAPTFEEIGKKKPPTFEEIGIGKPPAFEEIGEVISPELTSSELFREISEYPSAQELRPYDPSQPPIPGQVKGPYGEIIDTYAAIGAQLGIPFERISKAIAAPAWKLLQAATPDIKRQMIKGIIEQQATANTIGLGEENKKKEIER